MSLKVQDLLMNDLVDDYRDLQPREANAESLSDFEQARFGWDHAMVDACLAYDWKLPDELVCCIRYHHCGLQVLSDARLGQSPVAASALSALLPDQFCQDHHGLELLMDLQRKWPEFCLERLVESVDQQYLQLGLGVQNELPLLPLCRRLAINRSLSTARALEIGDR